MMAVNGLGAIGNNTVGKLNGKIYLKVKQILRVQDAWTSFIRSLDGQYTLSERELRNLEDKEDRVDRLILKLSSLQMTIQEFVDCARRALIHPILEEFGVTVPIRIVQEPLPMWNVTVGEPLTIQLLAAGSPPPSYQWFKDSQSVPDAISHVLHLARTTTRDSGVYICQLMSHRRDQVIQSIEVHVTVSPAKPLVIKEHPRSCTLTGGNALLRCEVWGDEDVEYQWMLNGKEVTDDRHVKGSNTSELRIYDVDSSDWDGLYSCRIARGEEVIFTQDAVLRMDIGRELPEGVRHKATDKVALLIGADDYRSEDLLQAPKYDVQTLATVFRHLNFRVVSLLNLKKEEMNAAIHVFKDLVGEGVYCVFYFAGHGFAAAGQCFLVPPDVPQGYDHRHCVSADAILFNVLLPRKPSFCCMILDICRTGREGTTPELLKPPEAEYIMCYATSQGLNSFEETTTGILVKHLKNILQRDIQVEEVFERLRKGVDGDPVWKDEKAWGKKQIPEIRTILTNSNRSFHDEINYRGYTQAYEARQEYWENAHRVPDPILRTVDFPGFSVTIRLDCQAELSNVLQIFYSVTDPGLAKSCKTFVSKIPADVAGQARNHSIQQGTETTLCKGCTIIPDVQRLRMDMIIEISVSCILQDGRQETRVITQDLGKPLVSPLEIWRNLPDVTRHNVPDEADESEYLPCPTMV